MTKSEIEQIITDLFVKTQDRADRSRQETFSKMFNEHTKRIEDVIHSMEIFKADFDHYKKSLQHHMTTEEHYSQKLEAKLDIAIEKIDNKKADKWVEDVIQKVNWMIISAVIGAILVTIGLVSR